MYEWLPWVGGMAEKVPEDAAGRIEFLNDWRGGGHMKVAETFRALMEKTYGLEARNVKYAEAFYEAPVGKKLSPKEFEIYFPFAL